MWQTLELIKTRWVQAIEKTESNGEVVVTFSRTAAREGTRIVYDRSKIANRWIESGSHHVGSVRNEKAAAKTKWRILVGEQDSLAFDESLRQRHPVLAQHRTHIRIGVELDIFKVHGGREARSSK